MVVAAAAPCLGVGGHEHDRRPWLAEASYYSSLVAAAAASSREAASSWRQAAVATSQLGAAWGEVAAPFQAAAAQGGSSWEAVASWEVVAYWGDHHKRMGEGGTV